MGVVNIQKTYGSGSGDVLKFLDGTMTAFICPKDIDEIYNYTFYNYGTTLRYVEIGDNIDFIGHYAFYGCNGVYSWKIPNSLHSIGQRAFCNTYSSYLYPNVKVALDFNSGTSNYTIVREYAFNNSFLLESINGNLRDVGEHAFNIGHESLLSSMHIKIQGSVGRSAFRYVRSSPENFSLDKDSNITSIGQEAFSRWDVTGVNSGYLFDLRNSTFTQMPYGVFSYICPMSVFYLPTSVSTMDNSVFSYTSNCVYYFSSSTPPTITTETFYNNTSSTIFVPYNNINTYKTATNWTSVAQYIKGWAPENTFSVGETLPTVNQEGYGLTWYTDRECTTQISVVVDADVELYCVAST